MVPYRVKLFKIYLSLGGKFPDLIGSGSAFTTYFSSSSSHSDCEVMLRIVSGNSDSCFYLDESTGILSAKCDLGRLPMVRRTLNLTATDGQHFADVMPIEINLIGG